MSNICSWKQSTKDKLKDVAETLKIDRSLIRHYTFVTENFDELVAEQNKEIAKIEKKKAEILNEYNQAPIKIKELQTHLKLIQKKYGNIRDISMNKKQKINRLKKLRERLAVLQEECEAEGIDVEEILNGIN